MMFYYTIIVLILQLQRFFPDRQIYTIIAFHTSKTVRISRIYMEIMILLLYLSTRSVCFPFNISTNIGKNGKKCLHLGGFDDKITLLQYAQNRGIIGR